MKALVSEYELKIAKTKEDAFHWLAQGYKPFAGGTDVMVVFETGKLKHRKFFSTLAIRELEGIQTTEKEIILGASTTYSQIRKNADIQNEFPLLAQAAAVTGAIAIQNRGTLGGNIANASPAADSPPALLVYDAELELISKSGSRRVSYAQFHSDYKKTALQPDELIQSIHLPKLKSDLRKTSYYRKVGTRKAQAISKVCFAGLLGIQPASQGDRVLFARIALGAVAPFPLRCHATEAALQSLTRTELQNTKNQLQLQDLLQKEISPISDLRSTADYRLQVARHLLMEFLDVGLAQ